MIFSILFNLSVPFKSPGPKIISRSSVSNKLLKLLDFNLVCFHKTEIKLMNKKMPYVYLTRKKKLKY